MKMKYVLMAMVAILTIGSVRAMTMDELQSAIDAAESGETVYVTSDISYDSALVVTKSVTIASADGSAFTLTRDASYAVGTLVTLATEGVNLTFANLVVDGDKASGKTHGAAVEVSAGTVTLENGFVLRNFYSTIQGGGVYVHTAGHLVMNDGAVIQDFENDSYGVAVLIGIGKDTDAADFTMNGGLITGCVDHHASASDGYGGAVYLYDGIPLFAAKAVRLQTMRPTIALPASTPFSAWWRSRAISRRPTTLAVSRTIWRSVANLGCGRFRSQAITRVR